MVELKGPRLICPICGKEAKTPWGLRGHLTGTRPYSGHELTAPEAAFTAAAATPLPTKAPVDADAYLVEALTNLVANKRLPKYEFERCVDPFLGVFLPEIVQKLLPERGQLSLASQEFPLKKLENNQSTNVDYVLHSFAATDRPWVFLELKTDNGSMKSSQARIYAERLPGTSMKRLLADVELIKAVSKKGPKYAALLKPFDRYKPWTGGVRVVYLTPGPDRATAAKLLPKNADAELVGAFDAILTCRTFAEVRTFELEKFPVSWLLFRDAVIPAILGDG